MITFTKNNRNIPVHGELANELITEKLFIDWIENGDPTWDIEQIVVQSIDRTPGGKTLFIKIKVDVKTEEVYMPARIVIIRNHSVSALTVLHCEGEKYLLTVRQPRVAVGASILEAVAGLIENDAHPGDVMFHELDEEADLLHQTGITRADIIPLLDRPMYITPGAVNEMTYPFLVEVNVSRELLDTYQGLQKGLAEEHESTTVCIIPMSEITQHCADVKILSMLYLYQQYLSNK